MYENELQHHGVKGMKWGVRKKRYETSDVRNKYDSTKAAYKSAKKAYNKAANKATNYSSAHPISQFTKKKRIEESDRRWNDAIDKGAALNKAQSAYKKAKKERKQQINQTADELNKKASMKEKFVYNDATRKKAAQYIVDNNMTVAEATKKAQGEAWRNTVAFAAAYGAITVASIYKANH